MEHLSARSEFGPSDSKAQALIRITGTLMKFKAPFVPLGQRMGEREPPLETMSDNRMLFY